MVGSREGVGHPLDQEPGTGRREDDPEARSAPGERHGRGRRLRGRRFGAGGGCVDEGAGRNPVGFGETRANSL